MTQPLKRIPVNAVRPVVREHVCVDFRWKSVEVVAPAALTAGQVTDVIYDQIRITATDAGDFVQRIEIRNGQALPEGWTKWTAFYLPGPPGCFPQKP